MTPQNPWKVVTALKKLKRQNAQDFRMWNQIKIMSKTIQERTSAEQFTMHQPLS